MSNPFQPSAKDIHRYYKINLPNGTYFYFDKILFKNLNYIKKANRNDWDFKILVSGDGMTRTGKSTLAAQIGVILDPNITLDRVIFKGEALIEKSMGVGKNKVIIYDEAKEGLDSKRAVESYSKKLTDYFSECGWMNQFIIVVLPEFFDLNKTIALNQSVFLVNCRISGNFERGNFDFYNRKDKRLLYIKGKKFQDYSKQKETFSGKFTGFFPFDKEEYERLKIDNQKNKGKEEHKRDIEPAMYSMAKRRVNIYVDAINKTFNYMVSENKLSKYKIAKISGMSPGTVNSMLEEGYGKID